MCFSLSACAHGCANAREADRGCDRGRGGDGDARESQHREGSLACRDTQHRKPFKRKNMNRDLSSVFPSASLPPLKVFSLRVS